MLIVVEHFFTT